MSRRLEGRSALVTGAASGIGRAIALALLREGAQVAATDIDKAQGKRLAADAGTGLAFLCHDVTGEAEWERVMEEAGRMHGPVDILVNNAGTVLMKDLLETSLDEWRRQHAVNLDGVFLGVRAAIRAMTGRSGGRIINISSVNGLVGVHTAPAYSSSKGGVTAFTKSAALYCADRGLDITVNSIHPGYVATPLVEGLARQIGTDSSRILTHFAKAHPMGRLGQPEDIAEGVVYLAGESGRWVTGSELVIDGGFLAR